MTMTNSYTYTARGRAVPAALLRWLLRRAEAQRNAAAQRALHELPDHLLRDIGLERGRF